jgi:sporulation protein YlmC with PRC-barrel domain
MTGRREVRIEELLGRQVIGANGRPVGRIEEFRAQRHGHGGVVNEILLGMMGMLARLDVGRKLLFGGKRGGYIVRMDQIDLSDPNKPKLTVAVEALEKIE